MKIVVVGSGVSGAHAALTLLELNHNVEMWDIGRQEIAFPEKETAFHALKQRLDDSIDYFLGSDLRGVVPPGKGELLRYPVSRHFLTSPEDPLWLFKSANFFPYASYNKGGLANGWGANALSFNDNDMADWPISFADMEAAYKTVYHRIPVAGPAKDDLTPHLGGTYCTQPSVRLGGGDQALLQGYARKRRQLQRLGIRIGMARLAVITDPKRKDACDYCDRCLWGCPRGSIYNPVLSTLKACEVFKGFRYVSGRLVMSLLTRENRITGIHYMDTATRKIHQESCDAVFLAAGALQTGGIFLRTLKAARPDIPIETEGLMDTSVVKIPFVALRSIGKSAETRSFQFNRLNMGIVTASDPWPDYLHGEVLLLTSLIYHPLIEHMPFDSRLSKKLFFTLKSALGVLTLFFPDKVTPNNRQELIEHGGQWEKTQLHYQQTEEKKIYIRQSIAKAQAALWRLGCVPKGILQSPHGGGIHYSGSVPMGKGQKRCDTSGRTNLFSNLYIADGAAFPSLPSKSITMSLAAHATRVARNAKL